MIPPLRRWEPGAPTLYILIGLPGSGKSFWVRDHMARCATPTHIASTDDVLERLAAERHLTYAQAHQTCFKEAEREFKAGMQKASQQGIDIIVDRTNVFQSARRKVMALIDSNTRVVYRRVGVVFDVHEAVLRERIERRHRETGKNVPWDVVTSMRESYVEPTGEEFHILNHVSA